MNEQKCGSLNLNDRTEFRSIEEQIARERQSLERYGLMRMGRRSPAGRNTKGLTTEENLHPDIRGDETFREA